MPLAPSSTPNLNELRVDDVVDAIVKWFFENYEDPANETPWTEGEYVYIWGGPYDAREELEENFYTTAPELLETALEKIEADGVEWAPSGWRIESEEEMEEATKPAA